MSQTSAQQLIETLKSFEDQSLSLLLPKPSLETGGEKWRILKKNAVQALPASQSSAAQLVSETVQELEQSDFKGLGMAFFSDGSNLVSAHLHRRPTATLVDQGYPLVLPVLADLADETTQWVVSIERDHARLYLYAGHRLEDQTGLLDAPAYSEVETRRGVQDDVFFHRTSTDTAKFHALGTDIEEERAKTDEAFFRDAANAVLKALPPQAERVAIFGGPKAVASIGDILEAQNISTKRFSASGSGLEPDAIIEQLASEKPAQVEVPDLAVMDLEQIAEAAKNARVEAIYVSTALTGLEAQGSPSDEHLRLRGFSEIEELYLANGVVINAVSSGAEIRFSPDLSAAEGNYLCAQMRWEKTAPAT